MNLSLEPFEKALHSLQIALAEPKNEIVRDATIQRFEYTFELCWKMLKRYFRLNNNAEISSVKEIFREAGRQGLIQSVEHWFAYLEARNLTSHVYDANVADSVYNTVKQFEPDAAYLLLQLKKALS